MTDEEREKFEEAEIDDMLFNEYCIRKEKGLVAMPFVGWKNSQDCLDFCSGK